MTSYAPPAMFWIVLTAFIMVFLIVFGWLVTKFTYHPEPPKTCPSCGQELPPELKK
jgi:hypothetical protein